MNKRGVGRPRDGNPEETRREILEAAEEGFSTAGFVGATTRKVAGRAGVNVATLHYHFGSKEGLYRAVMEASARGELPSPPPAGSNADRLARLVEGLYDFGVARPALSRLALLDLLAGPPRGALGPTGAPIGPPDEDPRIVAMRRFLASAPPNGRGASGLSSDAAARCIVTLVDASLVGRKAAARAGESRSGEVPDRIARAGVVAAALKIAGLS